MGKIYTYNSASKSYSEDFSITGEANQSWTDGSNGTSGSTGESLSALAINKAGNIAAFIGTKHSGSGTTAAGYSGYEGALKVYENDGGWTQKGSTIYPLEPHAFMGEGFRTLAVSSDGNTIVVAGTGKLWVFKYETDWTQFSEITFTGLGSNSSVDINDSGTRILYVESNPVSTKKVHVLNYSGIDPSDGSGIWSSIKEFSDTDYRNAYFAKDGKRILLSAFNGEIKVYEESDQCSFENRQSSPIQRYGFRNSSDGSVSNFQASNFSPHLPAMNFSKDLSDVIWAGYGLSTLVASNITTSRNENGIGGGFIFDTTNVLSGGNWIQKAYKSGSKGQTYGQFPEYVPNPYNPFTSHDGLVLSSMHPDGNWAVFVARTSTGTGNLVHGSAQYRANYYSGVATRSKKYYSGKEGTIYVYQKSGSNWVLNSSFSGGNVDTKDYAEFTSDPNSAAWMWSSAYWWKQMGGEGSVINSTGNIIIARSVGGPQIEIFTKSGSTWSRTYTGKPTLSTRYLFQDDVTPDFTTIAFRGGTNAPYYVDLWPLSGGNIIAGSKSHTFDDESYYDFKFLSNDKIVLLYYNSSNNTAFKVFEKNGSTWTQYGNTLELPFQLVSAGQTTSHKWGISSDGDTIAHQGNFSTSTIGAGEVSFHRLAGSSYEYLFTHNGLNSILARHIHLNEDGTKYAVAASDVKSTYIPSSGTHTYTGTQHIYINDVTECFAPWNQLGSTISGSSDGIGSNAGISEDGRVLAYMPENNKVNFYELGYFGDNTWHYVFSADVPCSDKNTAAIILNDRGNKFAIGSECAENNKGAIYSGSVPFCFFPTPTPSITPGPTGTPTPTPTVVPAEAGQIVFRHQLGTDTKLGYYFKQIGNGGATIFWGDGSSEPIPAGFSGIKDHAYVSPPAQLDVTIQGDVVGIGNLSASTQNIHLESMSSLTFSSIEGMKVLKDISFLYAGVKKLSSVQFSNFDSASSSLEKMVGTFANTGSGSPHDGQGSTSPSTMTNLDLRTLNVSKVQDMSNCFENCKVATIDLGTWNTESVTNMDNMFKGAEFSTLYIHNFNTSNVRTMRYMFADISKDATSRGTLFQSSNGHLNLSALSGTNSRIANYAYFDTSSVTSFIGMFRDCKFVGSINFSNWNTLSLAAPSLNSSGQLEDTSIGDFLSNNVDLRDNSIDFSKWCLPMFPLDWDFKNGSNTWSDTQVTVVPEAGNTACIPPTPTPSSSPTPTPSATCENVNNNIIGPCDTDGGSSKIGNSKGLAGSSDLALLGWASEGGNCETNQTPPSESNRGAAIIYNYNSGTNNYDPAESKAGDAAQFSEYSPSPGNVITEETGEHLSSIAINSAGTVFAICGWRNSGTETADGNYTGNEGSIKVYSLSGGTWSQKGTNIDSERAFHYMGQGNRPLCIDSTGDTIVAAGRDRIYIFKYINSSWQRWDHTVQSNGYSGKYITQGTTTNSSADLTFTSSYDSFESGINGQNSVDINRSGDRILCVNMNSTSSKSIFIIDYVATGWKIVKEINDTNYRNAYFADDGNQIITSATNGNIKIHEL